jgi:GNAT superfamily N-acetyltransferase
MEVKLMYDANLIGFKKLAVNDLGYLHKWLNYEFVIEWYSKKKWTYKEIEERYLPYINNEKPTQGYLILHDNIPIGFIQTYKIYDYPDYARFVDVDENAAGLDIFIGEPEYFHKGLGKYIIRKFLMEIVFCLSDAISCILGPEPKNIVAIKTYEKVGFKYIKTIHVEDEEEPEYLMRISKNQIVQI